MSVGGWSSSAPAPTACSVTPSTYGGVIAYAGCGHDVAAEVPIGGGDPCCLPQLGQVVVGEVQLGADPGRSFQQLLQAGEGAPGDGQLGAGQVGGDRSAAGVPADADPHTQPALDPDLNHRSSPLGEGGSGPPAQYAVMTAVPSLTAWTANDQPTVGCASTEARCFSAVAAVSDGVDGSRWSRTASSRRPGPQPVPA